MDIVNGKMIKKHKSEKVKKFLSFSVSIFFVLLVISAVISILSYKNYLNKSGSRNGAMIAGIANSIQIKILNQIYKIVSYKLTEWENFEYVQDFYDSLSIKVYLFTFVNSYFSMFYIAFMKMFIIEKECFKGDKKLFDK